MSMHVLTDITQQFQNATTGWHAYLFPIANHLFAVLAILELSLCGIWWALEKQAIEPIMIEFLKKILTIGFFYAILLNSNTWIPAILESFMKIGQGASHQYNLYPSDVMDQGISIAGNIFHTFHDNGIMSFGMSTLVGAFAGFVTLISFSVIAGLLVVSLVESYIVLGAGVLMLGFASNRITSKFAVNSLSYAMGVGAKLFMLYMVLGVGGNLANDWISKFQNLSSLDITPFLEVAGGSLVYLFVAWAIPHKAESLMSGSTSASVGGLIAAATVANSAGRMLGRTAAATGAAAMGGASSAIEAVKQIGTVGQGLGGGALGYAAGGVISGANVAASAVGSLTGHYGKANHAMKGKTANIKDFFANRAEKELSARPSEVNPPKQ